MTLAPRDADLPDRSTRRCRSGVESDPIRRGPPGHADRARWHRQDARLRDCRRRATWTSTRRRRTLFVPLASIARARDGATSCRRVAGATIEGNQPPLDVLIEHFGDDHALLILDNLEQVVAAAPELDQLLTSCPRRHDPGHQSNRASAARRARVRRRGADRASSTDELIRRAGCIVCRGAAVRRSRAGRASRLLADGAERAGRDRDLSSSRRFAARDRSSPQREPAARSRCVARSSGTGARRRWHGSGRSPRAATNASCDRRVEHRPARLRRTATALRPVGVLGRMDARRGDERVCRHTPRTRPSICSTRSRAHSLVSIEPGARQRFRMLVSVQELAAERLADSDRRDVVQARHAAYFAALVESDDWRGRAADRWADATDERKSRTSVVRFAWFFTSRCDGVAPPPSVAVAVLAVERPDAGGLGAGSASCDARRSCSTSSPVPKCCSRGV